MSAIVKLAREIDEFAFPRHRRDDCGMPVSFQEKAGCTRGLRPRAGWSTQERVLTLHTVRCGVRDGEATSVVKEHDVERVTETKRVRRRQLW